MTRREKEWEDHQKLVEELKATKTTLELEKGIGELDKELKSTGWETLKDKRKRGRLAREITSWGVAYAVKLVQARER